MSEQNINLFDVGCLLNLSIGTWSGRKMLTDVDMANVGIDTKNLPRDIVNYGRKLLVPKEELKKMTQIEQRARSYLDKWSVPFGAVNAHFVPGKMLETVDETLKGLQTEFFGAVDSFVKRFDDMKDTVKNKICKDHPEFWVRCLRNHYPNEPEILRSKFHFSWTTYQVKSLGDIDEASLEDLVGDDKAKQEKILARKNALQVQAETFAEEYVSVMRRETVKFCELMKARVNGKPYEDEEAPKKLTPRSISYFRKYVDRFRNMNIFGDQEIEKMLHDFRDKFLSEGITPSDLDHDNVKNSITEALTEIRKVASLEGETTSKLIGQLKRKVVI